MLDHVNALTLFIPQHHKSIQMTAAVLVEHHASCAKRLEAVVQLWSCAALAAGVYLVDGLDALSKHSVKLDFW